ncbi:MAG: sugar-transfer associated ATP-grasp domain-containing protein [Deltaproteobacteria bacterium]|nr:sugar-transfer associated ATP-grasp domain-containing protein [Deltaproteobacteria bacterium]
MRSLFSGLEALVKRRARVIGMNRRNVELVYPHNRRMDYPLADDKLLTKEVLAAAGVPTPEVIAICEALHRVPATLAALRGRSHFVVKPARGSGGDGILVVDEALEGGGWRRGPERIVDEDELRRHLGDIVFGAYAKDREDRAFVEEKVRADPVLGRLFPGALCDIRVLMLEGRVLMVMVRVPTRRSGGRANLHQGGVGLAVDLEDGELVRGLCGGKVITTHPDTGEPLLGTRIPAWEEILEVARRTAAAVPLGYLGIDLVVDAERGPLVLEINARPGLEIQNVHGRGLAQIVEAGP